MRKSPLLAATALLTLSSPALAQRTMPTPVALDPRIAALRDKALTDDTAYAIVESVTTRSARGPTVRRRKAVPAPGRWRR
jgi:hypothetical protein